VILLAGGIAGHGVEVVTGDVRDRASVAASVRGVTVVVSAVHGFAGPGRISPATVDRQGNINLIDAARDAGAEFVLVSVVGAAADSPMELSRMKNSAARHAPRSSWTAPTSPTTPAASTRPTPAFPSPPSAPASSRNRAA
jgi:uncharacterized protein YbjT (DUF2867 family)